MIKTIIVEDERLFRESLKKKIDKFNDFTVVATAANSRDAFLEIEKNIPDVIFTDVRMSGQDGLEFISDIRDKYDKEIIVVYVSGYPNFDYVRKAMQLKAFDYLTKPIIKEDLQIVINKIREVMQTKEEKPLPIQSKDVIEVAKEWILNHLMDASLEQVAAYVHMNPSSFSRKFKKYTGMTFIQFLTQERMTTARELLKNPVYKINEISQTVGYSDYQHFYMTFKKSFGVGPEEYRRQQR